ncbi:tripartite tricarboxylate transporter substrate binding protein [Vineibacter terrae]|uniref:Bug family tripartite tricarboxylate transporter substrate binding protein n=1 Tax=Vineibacter terrae TaxID=2586908 RepID=UPI002E33D261|nr:tripartite tricarboxylate transporter substrate binding protein [Vineibacter terrae]HEX2887139.1 tripartite tricarboxylate transporter substrate binding protein [Vineibacter terrae]
MTIAIRLAAWLAALLLPALASAADTWPERPVRVIVTAPPGSAPEVMARLVANGLSRTLGQQFIVDPRGGAGGNIALGALKRLPGDGYALGVVHAAAVTLTHRTMKQMQYDFDADFVPVALLATAPMMMVAADHAPAKTLPEMLALAKARPDTVSVAVPSVNSVPHLATEMLAHRSGSRLFSVPFNSSTAAISGLLSRDVMLMTDGIAALASLVEAGKLKPLAVFSGKRLPQYPGVPSVTEIVPDTAAIGWFVLVAPRSTPDDIVARLAAAIDQSAAAPEVVTRMAGLGMYPEPMSGDALKRFIKAEQDHWARVADQVGLQRQ